MSKIFSRHKQAVNSISGNTINLGAAGLGFRTVQKAVTDGDVAVGETGIPFVIEEEGTANFQEVYATVTSTSALTIERIARSSNGGQAVTFGAGTKWVYNTMLAEMYNAGVVNPFDPGYDIIGAMGQSNMVGQSSPDTTVDVTEPRISTFNSYPVETSTYRKITVATDPLRFNYSQTSMPPTGNGSGLSPASWAAKTYAGMVPSNRRVLIVPLARSNTKLFNDTREWFPGDGTAGSGVALGSAGSTLLDTAIDQATAAVAAAMLLYPNSRYVGTLWHQGEGDADYSGTSTQINYAGALKTLIQAVRTRVPTAANSWFVIGGLAPENIADTTNKVGYSRVDPAHKQVAAEVPGVAFAPAPSGYLNPDVLHFSATGARILGARMGAAIAQAIANKGGDTTAPTMRSATVYAADPLTISVAFSEPLDPATVPAAGTLTLAGHTVTGVRIAGNYAHLTVTPAFVSGEAARTLTSTGGFKDLYGNTMTGTSTQAITNNAGGAATVSSVAISPTNPAVAGGGTQQFTATVTGTNSPAQTVTWSMTGAGSISASGLYTAPAATSSAQTATITATSTVDATKSASTTVTIAATGGTTPTVSSVAVSPSTASVAGGGTQQFTATVTGTNSPAQTVTWTANVGTINSSGLYTAPAATGSAQTATVTATSTVDGTKSGTATVTIPATAGTSYGADQQFTNLATTNMDETSSTPPYAYTTKASQNFSATAQGGVSAKSAAGDFTFVVKINIVTARHMIGFQPGSANIAYGSIPFVFWAETSAGGGYKLRGTATTSPGVGRVPVNNDLVRISRVGTTVTAEVSSDNGTTWATILTWTQSGTVYAHILSEGSGQFIAPQGTGWA
jgi:hypothetical protein